jgi:hypothetical protein
MFGDLQCQHTIRTRRRQACRVGAKRLESAPPVPKVTWYAGGGREPVWEMRDCTKVQLATRNPLAASNHRTIARYP